FPFEDAFARSQAGVRVEAHARVPQAALVADLHARAAEDDAPEAGDGGYVPKGLEEQPEGLSAAGRAAVDNDVRRAGQELLLGAALRANLERYRRERQAATS